MFDAPPASRDYEARLLVEGWDEDTLTWNSQPADIGSATDTTSTGTSNNVWRQWDVTSDVQAFVNDELANYGWAIRDAEEGSDTARLAKFRSSDQGTELRRPQLVVDFAAPDDQPTDYKSPTAEEASDGNGLENNPEGAFEDGGTVASHTNNTAGESHIFYNYNPFDIPEGSTINGIEVRTDWYLDSTGGTNSLDVDLSWDGGDSWTDPKSEIKIMNKNITMGLAAAVIIGIILFFIGYNKNQEQQPDKINNLPSMTKFVKNGVQIEILKEGMGIEAKNGNIVAVHYTGVLENGTKFDSSVDRGISFEFNLGSGQVIRGCQRCREKVKE